MSEEDEQTYNQLLQSRICQLHGQVDVDELDIALLKATTFTKLGPEFLQRNWDEYAVALRDVAQIDRSTCRGKEFG